MHKNTRHGPRVTAGLAVVALLLSQPALAQIYKWVDAKGQTHYDSSPPPDGTSKAKTLDIPQDPTPTLAAQPSWQEQDNEFRARYDKRKADEAAAEAKQAQLDAKRKSACLRSQGELEALTRARAVYQMDAQGQRNYLNDAQIGGEITAARNSIAANC